MRGCHLVILAVFLAASLALAEGVAPIKPSPADKCPVCGMFVAKYPDFLAVVTFKDGSPRFFDGAKDLMKYYFNLPKYEAGKEAGEIAAILVTDYYSLKPIDAFQAYYVLGSDVYGPMGKELMPFRSEPDAQEFLKDHKGKAILRFGEISGGLLKSLD